MSWEVLIHGQLTLEKLAEISAQKTLKPSDNSSPKTVKIPALKGLNNKDH